MATQRNCSRIWILVPPANGRFNEVVDATVLELWKPDKKHSYVNWWKGIWLFGQCSQGFLSYLVI